MLLKCYKHIKWQINAEIFKVDRNFRKCVSVKVREVFFE